jgi:hypothetical protein
MNLKILEQIESPKEKINLEISPKWLSSDYIQFFNTFVKMVEISNESLWRF